MHHQPLGVLYRKTVVLARFYMNDYAIITDTSLRAELPYNTYIHLYEDEFDEMYAALCPG